MLHEKIEKRFGIKITESQLIKKAGKTYVSRILDDQDRMYVVKSGYLPEKRQDFIVQTEHLLSEKGVSLACPIADRDGQLYFMHKGAPYVLYSWVQGRSHPLSSLSDLKAFIQIIADLHRSSYGLKYPPKTKLFTHKDKTLLYRNQIKSMERFGCKYRQTSDDKIKEIVHAIPYFKKMACKAYHHLKGSGYPDYLKRPSSKQSLIHGDAHQGNILWHDSKSSFIDFEDVRFDLPSTDILRVYSKFTKRKKFDPETFEQMIEWYEEVNPLSSDERKMILIDSLFPHPFARMIRLRKFEQYPLNTLRHWIDQERKKAKYLCETYFKKEKKK